MTTPVDRQNAFEVMSFIFEHLPKDGHEWETRIRVQTKEDGSFEIQPKVKHFAIVDGEVFSPADQKVISCLMENEVRTILKEFRYKSETYWKSVEVALPDHVIEPLALRIAEVISEKFKK